ncbi:gamma carbonic anhydrase family protein [Candidatus Parvarchaeota archaeon]|nr:gamma carbonic anhydrase family protein [Candidatus Parvarchaeota archaeon]
MLGKFLGKKPTVHPSVYISDSAEIIGDVSIGENSSVWNGSVLRGDMNYIRIGKNTNVQDRSVLHGTAGKYPTVVGDNVSIGHGAIVHGCSIGDNCLIGMGSIILEGAEIGDWCIIGAGAVVTEGAKIPAKSLVLGIPGKTVREVDEEQRRRISRNWMSYVDLKDRYMKITTGSRRRF